MVTSIVSPAIATKSGNNTGLLIIGGLFLAGLVYYFGFYKPEQEAKEKK